MAKNVVGLFDNMSDAHGAVRELTNAGFTSDNISIVANNASGEYTNYDSTGSEAADGAGAGAVGGAVLGGLGGLLVGLGALAIPGVGPVIAALSRTTPAANTRTTTRPAAKLPTVRAQARLAALFWAVWVVYWLGLAP